MCCKRTPGRCVRKSSKSTKTIKMEFRALSGLRSQVSTLSLSLSTSHSLLFATLREHGRSFLGGGGCPIQTQSFFCRTFHGIIRALYPPSTFLLSCPLVTTQPAMERYARVSFQNVFSCSMASFLVVPLAKRCVSHSNPTFSHCVQ